MATRNPITNITKRFCFSYLFQPASPLPAYLFMNKLRKRCIRLPVNIARSQSTENYSAQARTRSDPIAIFNRIDNNYGYAPLITSAR